MCRILRHSAKTAAVAALSHPLRCLIRHRADELRRPILSPDLPDVEEIGKRGDDYLIGIIFSSHLPNHVDLSLLDLVIYLFAYFQALLSDINILQQYRDLGRIALITGHDNRGKTLLEVADGLPDALVILV